MKAAGYKERKNKTMYSDCMKSARLNANLTQVQVAEAMHISQAAIAKWENGIGSEPSIGRLIDMANLYGVSIDTLVGR